jgi:hypothetical protein
LASGATEILSRLEVTLSGNEGHRFNLKPQQLMCDIAECLGSRMGGTSGAVLEAFFRATGKILRFSFAKEL